MGAELAVKRGASHAKEDAQLLLAYAVSQGAPLFNLSIMITHAPAGPAYVILRSGYEYLTSPAGFVGIPGFLAPQSAHLSLPGTVLINSCRALSFRAWWRLLNVALILVCVLGSSPAR